MQHKFHAHTHTHSMHSMHRQQAIVISVSFTGGPLIGWHHPAFSHEHTTAALAAAALDRSAE